MLQMVLNTNNKSVWLKSVGAAGQFEKIDLLGHMNVQDNDGEQTGFYEWPANFLQT